MSIVFMTYVLKWSYLQPKYLNSWCTLPCFIVHPNIALIMETFKKLNPSLMQIDIFIPEWTRFQIYLINHKVGNNFLFCMLVLHHIIYLIHILPTLIYENTLYFLIFPNHWSITIKTTNWSAIKNVRSKIPGLVYNMD